MVAAGLAEYDNIHMQNAIIGPADAAISYSGPRAGCNGNYTVLAYSPCNLHETVTTGTCTGTMQRQGCSALSRGNLL